jgi:hypothetical protein
MTGYPSKRAAAQDKMEDDDTQVYQDHDDTLTIAYQSGYYDGKKAAQPAQEPPQYSFKAYWAEDGRIGVVGCIIRPDGGPHIMEEFIDPPQPAQEPVAWVGVDFDINTTPPQPASVTYKEVADTMNRLWRGTPEQKQIAIETENMRLYTAPPTAQPAQEPVAWMYPAAQCDRACLYVCTAGFTQFPECVSVPPLPAQEPVAWLCSPDENGLFDLPLTHKACKDCFPVYTAPPQRPWVGLTDKEAMQICEDCGCLSEDWLVLLDAIEAKLKEKNA